MVAWRENEGKSKNFLNTVLVGSMSLAYNRELKMPILEGQSLDFQSHSPEQTNRIGVRLGELLDLSDLVCLAGDLGSGKTTLAKGIARGWGSLDVVTSPSFILVNQYRRPDQQILYHVDAFRMEGVEDAYLIGLHELIEDKAPILLEWPERIAAMLPSERLWVTLRWVDELHRGLQIEAHGLRYERMLDQFRRSAFGG